ncbi:CPCC family cysteine-rich protein [Cupriavidus plantarum]|uniref:CPCC family cysteine-rich protein n=1 Tax=Cupriavidus plantarum TaxID=942865 RepID=UPI000D6B73FB|nr:CPCC family cysteine-rich protein [Cupriavidus plantarum]
MIKAAGIYAQYPCPCCGSLTLDELGVYEICIVCGWEDDPVQSSEPEYAGGANSCSLREAQLLWRNRGGESTQ